MPSIKKLSVFWVCLAIIIQSLSATGTSPTGNIVYPDLSQYNLTTNAAPLISDSSTLNFIGKFDLQGGSIETSVNVIGVIPETTLTANEIVWRL